jgi:hypothetical protein
VFAENERSLRPSAEREGSFVFAENVGKLAERRTRAGGWAFAENKEKERRAALLSGLLIMV